MHWGIILSAAGLLAAGAVRAILKMQPSERYVALICGVAALGGLLFGYDTAVISGAIGFLKIRFDLNAAWEGWTASCALLGCVIGVGLTGVLSDWLGRKKVLVLAALLFLISAIGTAIPRDLLTFIIFRIVGGIGVGAASMASPMYIAEVSPPRIRGRMVSVNQFAIISGMLIIYFVNYFIADPANEQWNVQTGWRWMFASGILPSLLFLVLLLIVPESPRWLIEANRRDEAFRVLQRINGSAVANAEIGEIQASLARDAGIVSTSIDRRLLRVLWIGIALAVLQQVTGINVFLYYAPEIFKKLGSGTNAALLQTVVVGAVNLAFTVIAIWTVDIFGRRPLMMIGSAGMGISLFALGMAAYVQRTEAWTLIFILGYIASFALSLGPVVWVVLSEIFPTRIRGRALSIATFCLWGSNFIVSQTFPMMNQNAWLVDKFHNAFPFWLYGALCAVTVVFVWKAVPETKGKSLEQIERMWQEDSRPGFEVIVKD